MMRNVSVLIAVRGVCPPLCLSVYVFVVVVNFSFVCLFVLALGYSGNPGTMWKGAFCVLPWI